MTIDCATGAFYFCSLIISHPLPPIDRVSLARLSRPYFWPSRAAKVSCGNWATTCDRVTRERTVRCVTNAQLVRQQVARDKRLIAVGNSGGCLKRPTAAYGHRGDTRPEEDTGYVTGGECPGRRTSSTGVGGNWAVDSRSEGRPLFF